MLNFKERNQKVMENIGLVHKMLDILYNTRRIENTSLYDYDDFYQTGILGLMKAVESYDEGKGTFSTYACTCIKNEILVKYKTQFTDKEKLNFFCSHLEDELDIELIFKSKESSRTITDIENISALRQSASKLLKKHKRSHHAKLGFEVMIKQYQGLTIQEAAEELSLSYGTAKRALQYFRTLLKQEDLSWAFLS